MGAVGSVNACYFSVHSQVGIVVPGRVVISGMAAGRWHMFLSRPVWKRGGVVDVFKDFLFSS